MSARPRRRVMVVCLIVCALGVALNLALWATGRGSEWTVILFTVEASGVVSTSHALRWMRGRR